MFASLVFCNLMASGVRGLPRKLQLYVRRLSGMMVGVDSLAARAAGEASAVGLTKDLATRQLRKLHHCVLQ